MKTKTALLFTLIAFMPLIFSSCMKDLFDPKPDEAEIEYSSDLYVIDTAELITISSFDSLGNINIPSTVPLSNKLSAGMIIAGGISSISPNGFLKKITEITNEGGQTTVKTENATFEDAFVNASVDFNRKLTIEDIASENHLKKGLSFKNSTGVGFFVDANDVVLWDGDGNPGTTNDQIKADGSIFIDPSISLSFKIKNQQLDQFSFLVSNDLNTEISIYVGSEVLSKETEYSLARINMNPIYIQAGILPIVVVPVLEITAGAKVEVNIQVETEISQTSKLAYGIEYASGSWSPISNSEYSFTYESPHLSANAQVKGYFGPQFNLLLYGIAGPYTDANAFLKLEADISDIPWWVLYGGAEVGVGVQVDFLGKTITDFYKPNVLQYQQIIAQASTGAEGTIKGLIKDALAQTALTGVSVKTRKDSQYYSETTSGFDGQFTIASPVGEAITVEFSKEGYLPVIYQNIVVTVNEDTYLEPVLQIDNSHNGNGSITGQILNAFDGMGISGANLSLRSGINATEGDVIKSGSSSSNGSYNIQNVPAGNYTIQAQRQGFTDSYFTVLCIGGQNLENQNGTMTPILNENEMRIILTWGESPYDLDSHLTGPAEGGNRFHVYYDSKNFYMNNLLYSALDHDDVTSFGPETVTIYELSQGIYRYSVHDFTNRNTNSSYELSNSSAQVRVYQGSTLISTFNVPSNSDGTLWTVFEMSNGQITPINSITYESSPGAIRTPEVNTDAKLLLNLPSKRK